VNIIENIFILLLTGIAVLLGLIVMVFTLGIMCDRWCCCCGVFAALHNDIPQHIEGGQVARDAGLREISQLEREMILEKLFVTKTYGGMTDKLLSNKKENGDSTSDDHIEMDVCIKDKTNHLKLNENTKNCCIDAYDGQTICAICLDDFDEHSEIIIGNKCAHIFHSKCIIHWLLKRDECPICRTVMMTSTEMRQSAEVVLGTKRLLELASL